MKEHAIIVFAASLVIIISSLLIASGRFHDGLVFAAIAGIFLLKAILKSSGIANDVQEKLILWSFAVSETAYVFWLLVNSEIKMTIFSAVFFGLTLLIGVRGNKTALVLNYFVFTIGVIFVLATFDCWGMCEHFHD